MSAVIFTCIQLFNSIMLYAHEQEAFRNFFGILRVREVNREAPRLAVYHLIHGVTNHGFQFKSDERRREPTAYFTENSGIGLAILNHPSYNAGLNIGVLGLGIGILAAYGRPCDTIRFYEINPDVIRLAKGAGGYFSYLRECPARVEVVPGDARISLEREAKAGVLPLYDLLVVDTFSSDSIPLHLLTKEAFAIYLQRLRPDGLLALHISNYHLDLRPVIRNLANHFRLRAVVISSQQNGERHYPSLWMLMSRNEGFFKLPAIANRVSPRERAGAEIRLWTDDYSNLFQLLK